MNKCGLAEKGDNQEREGSVLVLAIFTQQIPFTEFLTLPARSGQRDSQGLEIGDQLSGGLKLDAPQAKALSRFDISGNVIDIQGFFGTNFEGPKSLAVNERIRFTDSDGTGIDTNWEEIEKAVAGFHVMHVHGVGVGKQGKAVPFGEHLEEGILVDRDGIESAIPDFGKLLESEPSSQTLIQMEIPVTRRDASCLPVWPARIFFNGRPQFSRSVRSARSKSLHGTGDVHTHEDTPDVKDDGAELLRGHGLI